MASCLQPTPRMSVQTEETLSERDQALVSLFLGTQRGTDAEAMGRLVHGVLAHGEGPGNIADVAVLVMHGRWCRGGKGERTVSLHALSALFTHSPRAVAAVIKLLPHYGCWKDLLELGALCPGVQEHVSQVYAQQLLEDEKTIENHVEKTTLSLAGKYMPREKKASFEKSWGAAKQIRAALKAQSQQAWDNKRYRQLKTKLGAALDVCEVKMCANTRCQITIQKMPSRALMRYKRALLNVKKSTHPDHVECAARFEANLADPAFKLNGKACFPHELVAGVYGALNRKDAGPEMLVWNAQWRAVEKDVAAQISAGHAKDEAQDDSVAVQRANAVSRLDLGGITSDVAALALEVTRDIVLSAAEGAVETCANTNVVCMADVSGSMTGLPMHVSIAMGILVAKLNHGPFHERIMTFETEPQFVRLDTAQTLEHQVRQLAEAPWGGSTDFRRALNMVLQETAPGSEAPNLLVVSDMNFNEACIDAEDWALMHAEIVAAYDAKGCRTPTIFYWNVKADDEGVQETVHVPGVVMMNGFSPSMIGYVFTRQYAPAASGQGSAAPKHEMRPTTISLVRKILADADMARVRDAVSLGLTEGVDAGTCLGCGV